MNMNGGKMGNSKKSNAHLIAQQNGTLGGATHGYGPIGGNAMGNIKSNNSSVQNTMQGFSHLNMFSKNGTGQSSTANSKENMHFSKINGKLKKRSGIPNQLTGL